MRRLFKASLITICLTPAFALAQERCPIEKAVFAEADGGTELAFRPVGSDAAAVSHMFTVTGAKLKLDGHVMYDEESQRPAGMIMNNCPEGDATGAELRACTVWTGVLYSVNRSEAGIDVLGAEGTPAPDAVLLPGFGPAIRHSELWDKSGLKSVPWDLYAFKGCNG
ncbi:hypothetical protein CYG48_13600 [Neorhizobium sp. SOG26]|uniref:hypothetical protein n=1 Tax=Neorhizobium sp. SOG26 TaxID=2060726 RepID=UPI000E5688A9|nr:hypothetical protein [Neorhizobium sp. SOG26]AXV16630.1 hypothetical protein CYG48_13600 [Neorhizobium sp. SOG26]